MKKLRKQILILALSLFAVLSAAGVYLLFFSDWPGGMRPSYNATDYDSRLTREAKSAVPIANAAKKYFASHATYPSSVAQMQADLPSTSHTTPDRGIDGWLYFVAADGTGFSLSRRLGWDPSLQYSWDGSAEHWEFDPGDGSPKKSVALRP